MTTTVWQGSDKTVYESGCVQVDADGDLWVFDSNDEVLEWSKAGEWSELEVMP